MSDRGKFKNRKGDSRSELLKGLAKGEAAIAAGRVLTQSQAKKKLAKWLRG